MGRKIPGRKHHGVREPEKQRLQRIQSLKYKINAPPINVDDQAVPKSLLRIIELKNNVKQGLYKLQHRKKSQEVDSSKTAKTKQKTCKNRLEKPVPEFKQREGETDRAFLHRIHIICDQVTKEAAFEDKYGVDIRHNEETGEVDVVKRPKDELEKLLKKARKDKLKKGKQKNKSKTDDPKLTKSQKWHLKKQQKKQKKIQQNSENLKNVKDDVKFGEVVHEPPSLHAPKKAVPHNGAFRPGKKELLLKPLLNKNEIDEKMLNKSSIKLNKIKKTINRKGKRKDLPHALRRQLDKQQQEVIQAYRMLKGKNK